MSGFPNAPAIAMLCDMRWRRAAEIAGPAYDVVNGKHACRRTAAPEPGVHRVTERREVQEHRDLPSCNFGKVQGVKDEAVGQAPPVRRIGYDVLRTRCSLLQEIDPGFTVPVGVQVRADHGMPVVSKDLCNPAISARRFPDGTVEGLD